MPKSDLINTGRDKRYARRDDKRQFTTDQPGGGKSLAADRRTKAETIANPGQGDKGDQRRN